jgi:hypothetical protein
LALTIDRIEAEYGVTVSKRTPINSVAVSTLDAESTITVGNEVRPFRIPNSKCMP